MIEKWHRFRALPADARRDILHVMVLMPLTAIGLRVAGFRRWKALLDRFIPDGISESNIQDQVTRAQSITRAVRSGELHGLGHPSCLERSLVLWWLLRRAGINGELHIGARKNGPRFEAHAWVELDAHVLNDSANVHHHYSRFDAPIAATDADSHVARNKAGSRPAGKSSLIG